MSGIALYMLLADGERGAEVYCCANDRDQASIVWTEAANMVEASPQLKNKLELIKSQKRIVHAKTKSYFRALSSQASTKEGYNASCTLFDELHAFKTRDLWDCLRYAGASRTQPLLLAITTAGYDRESICWELHEYARKILEGTITDTSFFAYIAGATDEDDWTDPKVWERANPSYGVTIDATNFAQAYTEAMNEPRKENAFRRYRLNQWVGHSEQWLASQTWLQCKQPIDYEDLKGRDCFVGVDLARTVDLAAVVKLYKVDGVYIVVPHFYMPRDCAVKKEHTDGVPYKTWEREGLITLTDGDVIDFSFIREDIKQIAKDNWIVELGYDPWNAELLCNQMLGLEDGINVVQVKQTMQSLAPATSYLEKLLKEKGIQHDNAILDWNASNAIVREDVHQNIMIDKRNSTARVDGIAATIIALSRAMSQELENPYNSRGIIEL